MTTLQKVLIGGGVVVVIGAIVAASVLSKSEAKGTEVYMAKAEKRDLASAVTGTGKIEARTKVNIQSSVMGEMVELPVKEGDVVKKGDLLVQIDPKLYRSESDRLEANLRATRIALEQAEVDLVDAKRTLARQESLWGSSGLVSRELLDKSELAAKTAEINVKTLKERITQAEADLSRAHEELRKTTIRSPIDGTVTQLNAEKGEIAMTGTMNNAGTVIMTVSDMSEILATVDVDETRVVRVVPGQVARITVDAIGEAHTYDGKVSEIAGSAIKRTGTDVQIFPVKIALDKIDDRLRPGMTAKARIETQRAEGAITVPIQAVILKSRKDIENASKAKDKDAKKDGAKKDETKKEDAKKDDAKPDVPAAPAGAVKPRTDDMRECVYRVVDGKAVLTPVKTGIGDETSIVLLEGVKEGDVVITGPYRALKDLKPGEAVKEKKDDGKSAESSESAVKVEAD